MCQGINTELSKTRLAPTPKQVETEIIALFYERAVIEGNLKPTIQNKVLKIWPFRFIPERTSMNSIERYAKQRLGFSSVVRSLRVFIIRLFAVFGCLQTVNITAGTRVKETDLKEVFDHSKEERSES